MKKFIVFVSIALMVSLGGLMLASCGTSGGGGGGSTYLVLGVTSMGFNLLSLVKNGSINFSNLAMPITGEVVSDATVTISNETTGVSVDWPFSPPAGAYLGYPSAGPIAGDEYSLSVVAPEGTITGGPTVAPNPEYTINFSMGGPLPFTVTWEVADAGEYPATHTWILIISESDGLQRVVPIGTKQITIASGEVSSGTYNIYVQGINSMDLTGAQSGSLFYVAGSGGAPAFAELVIP